MLARGKNDLLLRHLEVICPTYKRALAHVDGIFFLFSSVSDLARLSLHVSGIHGSRISLAAMHIECIVIVRLSLYRQIYNHLGPRIRVSVQGF